MKEIPKIPAKHMVYICQYIALLLGLVSWGHGTPHASVAPIHKFADIPIYRFISFCTADTDANTDAALF